MAETAYIIDVDVTNFEQEVLLRSSEVPVVVDFWAPWCAPCKTLGPQLEALAKERAGSLVLAKVDTDKCPELAQAFQIQGVPTVVAIVDGRPADGFTGVLPPDELKAFIDKLAPPSQAAPLEVARQLEEEDRRGDGIQLLREWLREHPEDDTSRLELGRMLLDEDRSSESKKVYEKLGEEAQASDEGRALLARLGLQEGAGDIQKLEAQVAANPDDHGSRIELGKSLVAQGQNAEGLEHLLAVVKADRSFEEDAARKAMLEVFEALGDEHPDTVEFRQLLQMILLV